MNCKKCIHSGDCIFKKALESKISIVDFSPMERLVLESAMIGKCDLFSSSE